mmetsp:Transcript_79811/g.171058  ORF Transcript_79811/g.171058 Transcript_79811/m.171058 type:complete len:147 (+) Transcript_79811:98-538(+)
MILSTQPSEEKLPHERLHRRPPAECPPASSLPPTHLAPWTFFVQQCPWPSILVPPPIKAASRPLRTPAKICEPCAASDAKSKMWSQERMKVVSVGSLGHPYHCERPCKFVARSRGCFEGSTCKRCHLCTWSRAAERGDGDCTIQLD